MIGKTISHYKILEKLGEGGMGVVYKAEDTKLQRTVALKFLPLDVAGDDELRKRFINEARTASALNHPNICTIHAVEDSEQPFIAMEFVAGRELRYIVQSETPNLKSTIDYATQIAQGLQAAHKKGIVHRDIKPANIMVTDDGLVKVMDFGLAKMKGQPALTKTGSTLGTVAYMSPEQARNEEVDHRSDIFSFGVVLYELCSGRQPFAGDYEAATLYSVVHEEPEALPDAVPAELQRVVLKCLEKEADDRYQSAENLVSDLRMLRKDADSGSSQPATDSGKQSKRPILIAVSAVLLIAVASYFGYEFTKTESKPDNSVAIMYIENQTGEATYDRLAQNLIPQVYRQLFSSHNNVTQISPSLKSELEVLQKAEALDKIAIRKVLDDAGIKYRVAAGIQKSEAGLDFILEMTKPGEHPLIWQETLIKPDSVPDGGFAQELADWTEACITIDALEDSLHIGLGFPDNVTSRMGFKNWISTRAQATKYFYQGLYLREIKGAPADAIQSLDKAVQIDPGCAGAWAWGYYARNFGQDRIRWLEQWQQYGLKPSNRSGQLMFQALQALSDGTPDQLLKYLLAMMQYEEFPAQWNVDVGNVYYSLGDFENAVVYLREYMDIGLYPYHSTTYISLQSIYNIFGQWDEALHALEVGLERNPTNRTLMVQIIRQHLMLGKNLKADEWLDKYEAISKKMVLGKTDGYLAYGDHSLALGDFDKAHEFYQKALLAHDVSANHISLIAGQYIRMKKLDIAEELLVAAESGSPTNIQLMGRLNWLFRTKQEYAKALFYAQKVKELDLSDDLSIPLAKALFHDAKGEPLQAKAEWQKLIDQNMKRLNTYTNPFNYYELGYIYALKGDVQAALQMLESAFEKGHRNHFNFLYDPDLDNVRNDPRTKEGFAALLEKVKASYPAIAHNKGAEK